MKKIIIYCLILSSFTICYGQKDSTKTNFKRFQIGVNFSPNLSYLFLRQANGNNSNSNSTNVVKSNATIKYGYTAGLSFAFNLKRWLGIETGVQYNNMGYRTEKKSVNYFSPINPYILTKVNAIYTYAYNYIDVPLKINFMLGSRKLRFFTSIGASANFLIRLTHKEVMGNGVAKPQQITKFVGYNNVPRFNILPFISMGVDYQIKDFLTLRIAPILRYGVLSTNSLPTVNQVGTIGNTNPVIHQYLWNLGCNVACYINF